MMEQVRHFTCDCGDPWHGLQIYIDREATDDIPIVCTVVNENMRWADRLKAIWSILRGRLHILHEVYISRDEVNDFINFVTGVDIKRNSTSDIPVIEIKGN
mgnify:CR=1 FL=1